MKIKFLILVFILLPSVFWQPAYAQQTTKSNQIITRVGEAPEDQKPNISPTPGSTGEQKPVQGILDWASQITNGLQRGWENLLNKLLSTFSNGSYSAGPCPPNCVQNIYWCTHLIVDAYRLAGYEGLDRTAHAAVINMRRWWQSSTAKGLGYKYVDYSNDPQSILQVQPGYAMFMELVPGEFKQREHVNIVKEININPQGYGEIITLDSNTSNISNKYAVRNFKVENTLYPVRGFGGI